MSPVASMPSPCWPPMRQETWFTMRSAMWKPSPGGAGWRENADKHSWRRNKEKRPASIYSASSVVGPARLARGQRLRVAPVLDAHDLPHDDRVVVLAVVDVRHFALDGRRKLGEQRAPRERAAHDGRAAQVPVGPLDLLEEALRKVLLVRSEHVEREDARLLHEPIGVRLLPHAPDDHR